MVLNARGEVDKGYSPVVGVGMSLAPYVKLRNEAHDLIERGHRRGFRG